MSNGEGDPPRLGTVVELAIPLLGGRSPVAD